MFTIDCFRHATRDFQPAAAFRASASCDRDAAMACCTPCRWLMACYHAMPPARAAGATPPFEGPRGAAGLRRLALYKITFEADAADADGVTMPQPLRPR